MCIRDRSEAAVVADEVLGQIDFKPTVGSSDGALVCAGIAAVAEGTFSDSNNAAKLSFKTAASEAAAEKMALSSTGILTVTSSVVPSASDGGALGSAALEWSDLFLADGAVISFQDDQAVTLTSSATGLTLNSTMKMMFNDATQFVQGISATVLGLGATDEIDLTATAIDINGTVDMSGLVTVQTGIVPDAQDGAYLGTSSLQFSDLFLADAAVIAFGDDGEVTLTHVHNTGLLLSDDSGVGTTQLQFGDSGTFIHQSADGVLDVTSDTTLDLTAPTVTLTAAGADQVVKHATDAYDLAFQQADGNEVARIHDGGTAATIETTALDLTAGAAGKGGFGFKKPVYNVTAGADDADVVLAMNHSGSIIMITGSAYDMDIKLPAIAAGDEGFHITFVITTAFSSGNDLEIMANGIGTDTNDTIYLYGSDAGTSGADVAGAVSYTHLTLPTSDLV